MNLEQKMNAKVASNGKGYGNGSIRMRGEERRNDPTGSPRGRRIRPYKSKRGFLRKGESVYMIILSHRSSLIVESVNAISMAEAERKASSRRERSRGTSVKRIVKIQ